MTYRLPGTLVIFARVCQRAVYQPHVASNQVMNTQAHSATLYVSVSRHHMEPIRRYVMNQFKEIDRQVEHCMVTCWTAICVPE